MQKHGYLIHTWSDKAFKGTVVNWVLSTWNYTYSSFTVVFSQYFWKTVSNVYSSNTHQIYIEVGFSLGNRTDNIMTSSNHITVHKSENIYYRDCIVFESDIFMK